jgi:hypothetical protein
MSMTDLYARAAMSPNPHRGTRRWRDLEAWEVGL